MIYEALSLSDYFTLDYKEINQDNRKISVDYDFFAFNYHPRPMGWLNTRHLSKLPGLKITFVLEVAPNNPFVLCPSNDFDIYCALDPTLKINDTRIFSFPRPLEPPLVLENYSEPEIPVIGSFGFATPGKGFELLIDAVNREFDRAIVRINIPQGTFADDWTWKLQRRDYTEYLGELCNHVAKKGIEVQITHEYMTKAQLIQWCSHNTLNCFLYNRNQPGLSATTDQAISSGRPLAVSTNETFRHIHSYITPYPFRSLLDSIDKSQPEVLRMQEDWAPINFARAFERLLKNQEIFMTSKKRSKGTFVLDKNDYLQGLFDRGRKILSPLLNRSSNIPERSPNFFSDSESSNGKILIISHKEKQCGVYQYGLNISEALRKSKRYEFIYCECSDKNELARAIKKFCPQVIIYNYYPVTMPWLDAQITRSYSIPQLGIMHEVTQEEADNATKEMFDFHLCPDPTLIVRNPSVIKTKRLIPPYINMINLPEIPTIGSFGFGFRDKGFERVVELVQQEFDIAHIKILMPFNDIVDSKGKQHALATAKRCRSLVKKSGIKLHISHDFLSKNDLLDFLASNTINVFLYDITKNRGISSTIEYALAVQRPLAINKCGMFRHVLNTTPSICIEDSNLREIISQGIVPLVPFYNEWSEAAFIYNYEQIIDQILCGNTL
jgi:glycosyltransferase involved in cell wall biosynthesis